jgi:glutamate-ammonia-ligase adenylyltransferase
MSDALQASLASLERGELPEEAALGPCVVEPVSAVRTALAEALAFPELARDVGAWAPALLLSAQPAFGIHSLAGLAQRCRETHRTLALTDAPLTPAILGASRFLARQLLREPAQLESLAGAMPAAPDVLDPAAVRDWNPLRRAKYAGLLRIAARDIAGRPFRDGLRELSELADQTLRAGLALAATETACEPPALFALGKLGGRELNFSSDVDLLFLYETPNGAGASERHEAVARLVRHLKRALEDPTSEGFAYRVDLDLRPEGRAGVLANPVDAALDYYESFGAEWERQMLIRLRHVAGPADTAARFERGIRPFVYRRSIEPGVLAQVRQMKERIESERRDAGKDLEYNLKEGPGGIRDVEFLVQALLLFHGGRNPVLRTGNVLEALELLARERLLPDAPATELAECYVWLRRAEHALQLEDERQTQQFPRKPDAQRALARRLQDRDASAEKARNRMLDDWTRVRSSVRAHFEGLVLREAET